MPVGLEWHDHRTTVSCVVCGSAGDAEHVATVLLDDRPDIAVVRCAVCSSVHMSGELLSNTSDDATIDAYLEGGAGIDAIASGVLVADPSGVRRMLDVGCGYGFGMDVARHLYGWEVLGVEPSPAGARGARELGLDIRDGYMPDALDEGETFDLIVASEVLEHVPDPRAFLRSLADHLTPDGMVALTTPAAEAIDPANDVDLVLTALSPGYHGFLASEAGLTQMLRGAGFAAITVRRDGETLRARAALAAHVPLEGAALDAAALESYLVARWRTAPRGSALACGMATRWLASSIARGDFGTAREAADAAAAELLERHGLDLTDPAGVRAALTSGTAPSWGLAGAAHAMGMLNLLGEHRPDLAAEYLELALVALDEWRTYVDHLDAHSVNLRADAARHRALAVARARPEEGPAAVAEAATLLDEAGTARARFGVFTELVTSGHDAAAAPLVLDVAGTAPAAAAAADPQTRRAGLDALYCLATTAANAGDLEASSRWSAQARALLDPESPEDQVLLEGLDTHDSGLAVLQRGDGTDATSGPAAPARRVERYPASANLTVDDTAATDEDAATPVAPVSVILPLYNGQRYIATAIRSVVAQTVLPAELVIVDDGSSDEGIDVVLSLDLPFPLTVVTQPNQGQSAARNSGAAEAVGEVLAFIDQDDQWRRTHLESLVPVLLENPEVGWVYSDFDEVDGKGNVVTHCFIRELGLPQPKNSLVACVAGDIMALPSASVMRASAVLAVGGFDPQLRGYEDDDLFVRLFTAGWDHVFVPGSTTRYRVHVGGSSSDLSFLRSRMRYLSKLVDTLVVDHRLNRDMLHDVVLPRFFQATLSEYTQAIAMREYPRAAELAAALRTIAQMEERNGWRRRLELGLIAHPRRMRWLLLRVAKLPRWLQPRFNPGLDLRTRTAVRAELRA